MLFPLSLTETYPPKMYQCIQEPHTPMYTNNVLLLAQTVVLAVLLSNTGNTFSSIKSFYLRSLCHGYSRSGPLDIRCHRNMPLAFRDCMLVWTHRMNPVVMWVLSVSLFTVKLPGERRWNCTQPCPPHLPLQLQHQPPRPPEGPDAFLVSGWMAPRYFLSHIPFTKFLTHQFNISVKLRVRKEGKKTGEVFILNSHGLLMVPTFQWATVAIPWPSVPQTLPLCFIGRSA